LLTYILCHNYSIMEPFVTVWRVIIIEYKARLQIVISVPLKNDKINILNYPKVLIFLKIMLCICQMLLYEKRIIYTFWNCYILEIKKLYQQKHILKLKVYRYFDVTLMKLSIKTSWLQYNVLKTNLKSFLRALNHFLPPFFRRFAIFFKITNDSQFLPTNSCLAKICRKWLFTFVLRKMIFIYSVIIECNNN